MDRLKCFSPGADAQERAWMRWKDPDGCFDVVPVADTEHQDRDSLRDHILTGTVRLSYVEPSEILPDHTHSGPTFGGIAFGD